ncbi:MAG: ATP-binding protein [Acholeplasma sp.]|nr:ATP-binding protein [Acholeplasma sp.]
MKRSFTVYNLVLIVLVIIGYLAITFSLTNYVNKRQTSMMLKIILNDTIVSYNAYGDTDETFVSLHQYSMKRISILDETGNPLADSMIISVGGNQSDYPEIIHLGKAYPRYSDSLKMNLMYVAGKAENGNYVRVAVVMDENIALNEQTIWVLVIFSMGVLCLSYMTLKSTTKLFLKPIHEVSNSVRSIKDGNYQWILPNSDYDEINDLLREINGINEQIVMQIKDLELKEEELQLLLKHMHQGVLVIGSDESLILSNEFARQLLSLEEQEPLSSIRQPLIYHTIQKATQSNVQESIKVMMNQKNILITISSVSNKILVKDKNPFGVLVVLADETERVRLETNKRDFFANASHELRTPLTAIKGSAELIHYDMVNEDTKKRLSKDIIDQIETMDNLLKDMLELARLETRPKTEKRLINLHDVLKSTLEQLDSLAQSKAIEISLKAEEVVYNGVDSDFRSLFKNLVENAIKYNVNNGKIDIELFKTDQVVFRVKDTGIGIPNDQKDRIFERFYQINKTRSKLQNGTGLGLAIVKHVTSYYEGQIVVESKEEVGTTITVLLP